MISKELLSEVLNQDVKDLEIWKENSIRYFAPKDYILNIYELAHKCKEWAYLNKQEIRSYHSVLWKDYRVEAIDIDGNIMPFKADTEQESVFKACQWILDSKEQ